MVGQWGVLVNLILKNDNLYNFPKTAEILGVSTNRLFELSASSYVEKVHQDNRIYFTKESIRKMVLRGDV